MSMCTMLIAVTNFNNCNEHQHTQARTHTHRAYLIWREGEGERFSYYGGREVEWDGRSE